MVKKRSVFKEHGKDPTKRYRRKHTDYQVACLAETARQARLRDRTPAEQAFDEMLRGMGLVFEREKIVQNGDRFLLLDFYIPALKLAVEVDGRYHAAQAKYDEGRSQFLAKKGIKVIRFSNEEVLRKPVQTKAMLFIESQGLAPPLLKFDT